MHLKNLGNLTEAFNELKNVGDVLNLSTKSFDLLENSFKDLSESQIIAKLSTSGLSDSLKQQIGTVAGVEISTATLSASQKKATTSTLGLGAAFKGLGATLKAFVISNPLLAGLAVIGALTAAYYKWGDTVKNASKKAKESLEEYQKTADDVKSLNDELDTTASKIDELNAKENLTLVEIDELEKLREANDELERELSIRKALEEQQGKKANDDALDYFNKNSTYGTSAGRIDISGNQIEILDYQLKKIKELEEYFKTADASNKDFLYVNNERLLANLKEQVAETVETFMEIDDGLVDGMDDGVISLLNDIYDRYSESVGTFGETQTEKISGILAKADFEKYNDTLMELGEAGKLSINELSSQFPDLISYLQEAGVSAEELYKYIMSLSNPDAINYDEVRKQLMGSVGIDGSVDSAYEAKLLDKLNKSGLTGNEGLEAYLQVKAKYTDGQTEFWSIDDWISNIKAEMSSLEESNETPILSISDTIDLLNSQLKPTFDSLKSAYQDIFTIEDGVEVFNPENVNIDMLKDIKDSLGEINEIEGVEIDLSSYDDLVKTLTDSSSEADDVKQAFNNLSASVMNSLKPSLSEVSGEQYLLIQSMLESLGVMNSEEAMISTLGYSYAEYVAAKEEATQAGFNLANSTEDEISKFTMEQVASDNCGEALATLQLKKLLVNSTQINATSDIQQILALANAANITSSTLVSLANAKSQFDLASASGDKQGMALAARAVKEAGQKSKDEILNYQLPEIDFNGNVGSAGKAGKEVADAYLEAFEEELSKLDTLKDQGKISEKQYLDALRKLYVKYFNQKEKYLDQFQKYEYQYLSGMKSLYESAFSYITKQIDKRIDALNDEKDAVVSSLEAERDARLEAIELQQEQLQNEIDGIDKQIDAKEKEIKALQDANEERKNQINLQEKLYNLEKMQNQRTNLTYKDGQMSYEADTSGIADARQEVEDAKLEINISNMEKEVDLLENQKDLLQEQIDLLDKQADAINDYYDKLIENTEKQYEAMTKGLEETKSKFTELSEVFENAQMEATLQELGINMEALLSGSTEEFDKLKTSYIGILADMGRGNDEVVGQLSQLAGVNAESVSYLESTKSAFENLGAATLDPLSTSVEETATATEGLSTSATEASTAVGEIGTNASNTTASITPLNDELQKLKDLISELTTLFDSLEFPTPGDEGYAQKLEAIATAFGNIATKCKEFEQINFSFIIGTGGEDGQGTGFAGLGSVISDAVTTIDLQMESLKTALQTGNDAFDTQIKKIQNEYVPAWEKLQTRLAEIIGVGGGGGASEDGTRTKTKTTTETDTEGGSGSIVDIMQTGGDEVSAKLQDPWLTSFNDFATGENSIQSIANLIKDIVTEMATSIQSQCEAAAKAIKDLADTALNSSISIGGSSSNKPSNGKAFASGSDGLSSNENNALIGEKPEILLRDGEYSLITSPTIMDLKKDDVVYNNEDTKKILSGKGNVNGNAYAEGTASRSNIVPIDYTAPGNENLRKFKEYMEKSSEVMTDLKNVIDHPFKDIADSVTKISNSVVNNTSNRQSIEVNIGDIQLQGVQDTNSLSSAIIERLPNTLAQELHRR